MFASAAALIFSAWLASIPGQAEDTMSEGDTQRKPVTCTDAAGIIYDRGTPGFERCLQEMNQAAQAESEKQSEQAGKTGKKPSSRKSRKGPRPMNTPTTSPTVAPEAIGTE